MPEDFISLTENAWNGLNALAQPDRMAPGDLTTADNVVLAGGVGGALAIRPGVRAQLTAALGSPFYEAVVFTKAGGTNTLVAAAGGTANGRIYAWDKNSPSAPTALTALGTFNAPQVQMTRLGDYLFISGNTDGLMRRTDLSGTFETLAGLTRPNYTANAVAANRLINLLNLTGSWKPDAAATATASLLDPNFTAASLTGITTGAELSTGAWIVNGGTVEAKANAGNAIDANSGTGTRFVLFDDQPSSISQLYRVTASAKTNANGVGSVTRRAVHFRVSFTYRSAFVGDSVDVTMVAYSATGEVARSTQRVGSTNTGAAARYNLLFTFGSIPDTTLVTFGLTFSGTEANTPGASGGGTGLGGPYVGLVSVVPVVVPAIEFASQAGEVQTRNVGEAGMNYTGGTIPVGYVRLSYDLGSAMNLSTIQNVAIGFNQDAAYPITGIRARLGLRHYPLAPTIFTNDFQFVTDPASGLQYATTDLSSTTGSLTAIQYLDLQFENDATYAVPNTVNLPFIRLGAFSFAGNLTIGSNYAWRFVEATGQSISGTLLTSPAGYPSQYVQATSLRATGEITAANGTVPTNTSADILAYRNGGTFLDALYRLVARFSPTAGTTGTFWSWSTAGGAFVFSDYTPDSQLISSSDPSFILQDHTTPPTACYAVGTHANRLALLAPDGLHLSQLQSGRATGMYWDLVNDASAPGASIQGFFTQISGADGTQTGGPPARLVNYLARLWVLFQNSIWEFGGVDQSDFALRRFVADEGRGLIAARGITIFDGKVWFVSSDGLRVLDGYDSKRVSERIDRLINPQGAFAGAPLNVAAYANAAVFSNSGRIYLTAPLPGASDVNALYLWDLRGGGAWTRWTVSGIYNGVTFGSATDTDDLCLLSSAGQLFYVGPGGAYGDTTAAGGPVLPVTASVTSRAFTGPSGEQFWLDAQRFGLALAPSDLAGATATFVITGQGPAAQQATATCFFPGSGVETDLARQKVPSRVRGRYVYWSVVVTQTGYLLIPRVGLLATLGRQT